MLPNEPAWLTREKCAWGKATIKTRPNRSALCSFDLLQPNVMPPAHGAKIARARDRSRKKYPPPAKKVLPELIGARGVSQLGVAQQVLAQIRESIIITDTQIKEPGPNIVYVNKAFTRLTGYLPNEVIGKNPGILQGPKTTLFTIERLRACLEKGQKFEGEDINYRKDGSEFQVDWYVEPLRDDKGRIAYFVGVQRDVTERRRKDADSVRARRLEGVGLLARGIAHDLNNVLTPIIMGSDLLDRKINDPDSGQLLAMLERSADRGSSLVKQLLALARGLTGTAHTIARDGAGRSILIVNDEIAVTEIMKEILTSAGYQITTAACTSEALERAEETAPDAVLLDLRLAGALGNSLLLELRARFQDVALIVLSDVPRNEINDIATLASAIVQKPFTVENLLVAVHDVIAAQETAAD
jgi:PAS domain S-box-containing protein